MDSPLRSTRILNLGILAHVDAGKTTLTERLLYAAGVIDEPGSVDAGTTRTDTLALERQRGITIKSAVVSFRLHGRTVNLLDTPGHPDFIAEVERVLDVLDGAVLVISAVEGVQPQTRVLMRTLHRLRIPTLLFVNKIDRVGAGYRRVLEEIRERLTPDIVAMGRAAGLGTRAASFTAYPGGGSGSALLDLLSRHDEALLAGYVTDPATVTGQRLRASLVAQTGRARVHPVYFGSAVTGAGVDALAAGIAELLPPAPDATRAPVSGTVFKVERGPAGERVAYLRMRAGTLRVRDRVRLHRPGRGPGPTGARRGSRVTGLRVFADGTAVPRDAVTAGQIATVWGLTGVRIGDQVGTPDPAGPRRHFAPPTLETVVVARDPADRGALHAALTELAEQDPLINLRQDGHRGEISVSLYGEVQKEVIQATLASEYGVAVSFRESTTICVERPVGSGAAAELMKAGGNPFLATVGLRVDPAPPGTGVSFSLAVELGSMPYAFFRAVEETVRRTLREGLRGWQVVDCAVTMTHSGYAPRQSHAHQRFDKSMSSTGADFRGLTPLVLMAALREAGTAVHEPVHRFQLETPADLVGTVLPALARAQAVAHRTATRGRTSLIAGEIPAGRVPALQRLVPDLTRGEGWLETDFAHYQPVRGPAPHRSRTDHNPLDRREYLLRVTRRVHTGL